MKPIFFLLVTILIVLTRCSSLPSPEAFAKKVAIKASMPLLEKVLMTEASISPSSRSVFPTTPSLPGPNFNPHPFFKSIVRRNNQGEIILQPGDYILPVMTYCMKSSGSSPNAHRYVLSTIVGKNADIIRELHSKGMNFFLSSEIQIVSWNIQNGISYEEMPERSKKIVDKVLAKYKPRLQKSLYSQLADKWNFLASTSPSLPRFEQLTDEILEDVGVVGETISKVKRYREVLKTYGHDYGRLSSLISITENSPTSGETPWSRLSERVYARFVTKGHYQQVGHLEVRVLPRNKVVQRNSYFRLASFQLVSETSSDGEGVPIDPSALTADPGVGNIQPLGMNALTPFMSGLALAGGTLTAPQIAMLIAALTAIIAIQNWNTFWDAAKQNQNSPHQEVQDTINDGNQALSKAHDELDKHAQEAGIDRPGTKDTTKDPSNPTREKTQPPGSNIEEDFARFPGQEQPTSSPDVRIKVMPNGDKVIIRTQPSASSPPTIEIQPGNGGSARVKYRYP